jgi:tetratricopeptide (TPR) repeat protein
LSDLDQAQVHYREGRLPESERIYQDLIDRPEPSPAALYGLALMRISQGKDPAAAELLQRSLEYERTPNALYYLGEIAERRGDREAAIASYGEALALPADACSGARPDRGDRRRQRSAGCRPASAPACSVLRDGE